MCIHSTGGEDGYLITISAIWPEHFILHTYLITVFIGEEDTMVNKIVVVDKIVHLGPPLSHFRGLLYKIV